jgi:hypothetical protein
MRTPAFTGSIVKKSSHPETSQAGRLLFAAATRMTAWRPGRWGPAVVLPRVIGGGCAGLVLILCLLAACPEAHHWLHHDSDEPGHDCAVVMFAHGLALAGDSAIPEAIFLFLVALVAAIYRTPDLCRPRYALQPERGPPRN